jgi:hypothetical protein
MNYGETLVEWYLRLNGFFLVRNFVLHDTGNERTADWDLLAIRFPHVYEAIGGTLDDWDHRTFESWDFALSEQIIGLMVEVKTGELDTTEISKITENKFSNRRIRRALERIGMFNEQQRELMLQGLQAQKAFSLSDLPYRVGKVVIVKEAVMRQTAFKEKLSHAALSLSLEKVNEFILKRMDRARKQADRLYFPDELMQYIAWSQRLYLCTFRLSRLKRRTGRIRSRVGLPIGTAHEATPGRAVDGGAGFRVAPRQW